MYPSSRSTWSQDLRTTRARPTQCWCLQKASSRYGDGRKVTVASPPTPIAPMGLSSRSTRRGPSAKRSSLRSIPIDRLLSALRQLATVLDRPNLSQPSCRDNAPSNSSIVCLSHIGVDRPCPQMETCPLFNHLAVVVVVPITCTRLSRNARLKVIRQFITANRLSLNLLDS
ncbi:hypothetical protein Q31b_40570 [Novipirellula aureliae]|uniref:Uncharacterized protein n=1 Tax=Novipirellula aureliae TaxID=2527966 RepID=A0A5C6DVX8_9BACT|nr:hypothetical protein Q31b_40570 [Novipirellula aureliae]